MVKDVKIEKSQSSFYYLFFVSASGLEFKTLTSEFGSTILSFIKLHQNVVLYEVDIVSTIKHELCMIIVSNIVDIMSKDIMITKSASSF